MKPDSGALRHFGRITNGTTPASGEIDYWDGDVLWATPEDLGKLTSDRISQTKRQVTEKAVAECNLSVLPTGSVIISTRAPIGHMAINEKPMAFNQGCRGIIPGDQVDGPFLYYLLKSRAPALNAIANGTTFVELTRDELAAVPVELPPIDTQRRIARILDEKTARIDELIAKKRELLDRLAEKRQTLITRAVTKGLNPEAPMKPSGIDWLGNIPAHWEILPLRRITLRVATGRTPPSTTVDYFTDGLVNWFTPGDFSTGIELKESNRKVTPQAIEDGVCTLFPTKTVFLIGIGATLGKVAVSTTKGSANQQINAILSDKNNDPYFIAYFLYGFRTEVRATSNSNTLGILNQDGTKTLLMPVPPLAEQEAIASEVRAYDSLEAKVIQEIKKSIGVLLVYRSVLITAAVTGKITELK